MASRLDRTLVYDLDRARGDESKRGHLHRRAAMPSLRKDLACLAPLLLPPPCVVGGLAGPALSVGLSVLQITGVRWTEEGDVPRGEGSTVSSQMGGDTGQRARIQSSGVRWPVGVASAFASPLCSLSIHLSH